MIMDERTEFADATSLNTGAAGSYLIGDVVDLTNTGRDIGNGEPTMYLVIQVDTTATSGGSATVAFSLVSDAQAAIATDGSATVHYNSGAIPVATLAAGYGAVAVPLPRGSYERYLGVLQTTAVAALTAGKINAFLTENPPKWAAYTDGVV